MKMREPIKEFVVQRTRGKVQSGPFGGMQIVPRSCWGDGDITAKLLGVYEQELHDVFYAAFAAEYDAFVDIGCADGYYAVGMAKICPAVPVYAYDLSTEAEDLLKANGALNGVGERIHFGGRCAPADLVVLAQQHAPLFILCDCEGYESELFSDPEVQKALQRSDIVVECHDFMDPICTPWVFASLWQTHRIDIRYSGARDPGSIPMLSRFSDLERWIAICENRPKLMNWLVCRPR
jgi:hypothetical protein